jgi:hypothetical protein
MCDVSALVSGVVNTFLSQYVEGIDSEQLGLHLIGGEIRLENIKIKGTALDGLHLPVEVAFGYIGLLHVKWDWTQLMSKVNRLRIIPHFRPSSLQ